MSGTAGAAAPASNRWPALDGMRGVMTVGVFVAHIKYDWLPGAILFMDTFFMMSSFFITRLLMKDWSRSGRLDFRTFYVRRVKRLYPALVLMVVVVTAFMMVFRGLRPTDLLHVVATLFYFANWLRAFDIAHDPVLGHTWSLSIEEQFYLVWPVLLAFGLGLGSPRADTVAPAAPRRIHYRFWLLALGAIALLTFAWRTWLAVHGASVPRLYNGTDMRLDSLALGALLALCFDAAPVQRACARLAQPGLVWLMLVCMMYGALTVDVRNAYWYAWQQPVFVLLSLALLMAFLKTPTAWGLGSLFQNPVALYLGAICYGLYLWHYPLIELGRGMYGLKVWDSLLICAPLSLALASLSYHFIELPMLKGHRGSAR